jgi:transposase InsO family protein
MNREVHVRFWESAGLRCPAPLTYLMAYATGSEARLGIGRWIDGYNARRPHQALAYRTPNEVYAGMVAVPTTAAAAA